MRFPLFPLFSLLCTIGCAYQGSDKVDVGGIADPRMSYLGSVGESAVTVSVLNFSDARGQAAPSFTGGQRVEASGDVIAVVRDGFVRELVRSGIRVAVKGGATLSGEVRNWSATVKEGFPLSHVEAVAVVSITVLGLNQRVIYSGEYTGETSVDHPFVTDSKVQSILGDSMTYALQEAAGDAQLRSKLIEASLGY